MTAREPLLLLDEMLSPAIARQLVQRGHDVTSVVTEPALVGMADDQVLATATDQQRALVTANVRDFVALDASTQSTGGQHGGLVLVSSKTFPQDRHQTGALVRALASLLDRPGGLEPNRVVFLAR